MARVSGAGTNKQETGTTKRRSLTFRGRVSLAFAMVSVLTSILFVLVLTLVWNGQFNVYTRDNMEQVASSAATALASEYDSRGYWNVTGLQGALSPVSSLFQDLGIQVKDSGGVIKYDNTWLAAADSNISLAPDASSMVSEPIVSDTGRQVGTISVWALGSSAFLTPKDILFRDNTFRAVAVAAGLAAVLSVVVGLLVSRLLTTPVRGITNAAKALKEGDLTARTGVVGSDDVGQLGETFDEMADVLEKDRELEKRLTADVAHELRTPLMAILATVEAMEDEVLPCDQEHLALVGGETKRLSRLVDSMLHLSRLENGSVQMHFIDVDVVDFVQGMATSRRPLLEDAGLTLNFENRTGSEESVAELDCDTITQAVTNLLSNAMRYTPAPGTVTLAVDDTPDEVHISVTDTGMGISPENLNRVFGRFWRAEESRNRAKGGLGVGLAVTKEIMDCHHGRVDVESELGVGTTFTLILPRKQPKVESDALETHTVDAQGRRGKGRPHRLWSTKTDDDVPAGKEQH